MIGKTCTVKFFLYKKVKHTTKGYPIYARINFNRKKAEFSTGQYCKTKNWNSEIGAPIRDPKIREYLIFVENKILQIKRNFELEETSFSAKTLRDSFRGKKDKSSPIQLLDYFDKYIEKISRLKEDYAPGTVKHYITTRKHLEAFLITKSLKELSFVEFDKRLVKDFDEYLMTNPTQQTGKPLARNTANKYHAKFKTVIYSAIKDDIIAKSPYIGFTLKNKPVHRAHLTSEELELLRNNNLGGNEGLIKARDIFLWSCYTGLRYSDAQNLTKKNVIHDENGSHWLHFKQQKTSEDLFIPLPNRAIELYDKYESLREITGKILPSLVNQKVNTYLKVIAEIVGINKKLTHHVARHTFATTIMLDNNVPIESVKAFLGHQSLKSTQIYAKITRENMLQTIKLLNNQI